jgi:hypothetical protein
MRRALLPTLAFAAALAACGDNVALPDAAIAPACAARFTGNFSESSSSDTPCASLAPKESDWSLSFGVPVEALDSTLAISIDLGAAPAIGTRSSADTAAWNARAVHVIGDSACIYAAGATAIPSGSFTLALDTIDLGARRAHGSLALTLYVLTEPGVACGDPDTEALELAF